MTVETTAERIVCRETGMTAEPSTTFGLWTCAAWPDRVFAYGEIMPALLACEEAAWLGLLSGEGGADRWARVDGWLTDAGLTRADLPPVLTWKSAPAED